MEKIVLADGTEFEVQPGASLGETKVVVADFAGLGTVAEALSKNGNLAIVQYKNGEQVTGNYEDMKLKSPLFAAVDYTDDKKVVASFGIREKTELEKRIDALEGRADVTEGALQEMILSTMGGE